MTVKRSYVARRITLLAVAAMAAVAAATVLSATAQNQAPPPRHQLRVERTARQVSAAGASATAIAITPNARTAYVVTAGDSVTPGHPATQITRHTADPRPPNARAGGPAQLAPPPSGPPPTAAKRIKTPSPPGRVGQAGPPQRGTKTPN